jgi:uncharacterized protein HemY
MAGDSTLETQAIADLKRAPKDNAVARCELGRIYQADRQFTEARAELEACIQLDPSPQNHYRLGLVYNRLGLAELAQKQMELRAAAEQRMSEENARREKAVETFRYLIK